MLQKVKRGMEKWGHYLLAVLCAGVILISAAWTRDQRAAESENKTALADQSQRLADAGPTAAPMVWLRPVSGKVLQGYSEAPVYYVERGVWKVHSGVDFAAEEGDIVCAMGAGTVTEIQGTVRIDHGKGYTSAYRGLDKITVQKDQRVKAGESLGIAGGGVPFEGENRVCVTLLKDGMPVPFGGEWTEED